MSDRSRQHVIDWLAAHPLKDAPLTIEQLVTLLDVYATDREREVHRRMYLRLRRAKAHSRTLQQQLDRVYSYAQEPVVVQSVTPISLDEVRVMVSGMVDGMAPPVAEAPLTVLTRFPIVMVEPEADAAGVTVTDCVACGDPVLVGTLYCRLHQTLGYGGADAAFSGRDV